MGQVSVTLNNRTYKLACSDGEEPRLADLARDVKTRVENLAREFGQPADERILLMAAVLLADELMDLREAHEAMLAAAAEVLREAAAQQVAPSDGGKSVPPPREPAAQGEPGAGAGKNAVGRSEPSKPDASKPSSAQQEGGKGQPRPAQAGGGSGHPALPQAPVQPHNKGAKTSTG